MSSKGKRVSRENLVHAAASALASQYAEIIELPAFGLVFDAYFSGGAGAAEFAPLYEVFRTREEIDVQTGNRLLDPPFEAGPECEALFAYIEKREAWDLADAYFAALCDQLRERLGIRVEAGSSEGELRLLLVGP
jgi:hypothetical protein